MTGRLSEAGVAQTLKWSHENRLVELKSSNLLTETYGESKIAHKSSVATGNALWERCTRIWRWLWLSESRMARMTRRNTDRGLACQGGVGLGSCGGGRMRPTRQGLPGHVAGGLRWAERWRRATHPRWRP